MSTGFPVDELAEQLAKIKGISVGDALRVLNGRDFANSAQWAMRGATGGAKGVLNKGIKGTVARMAGSKPVYNALRVVPGLTAGLAAFDAADIVTNDTSIGNKAPLHAGLHQDAAVSYRDATISVIIGIPAERQRLTHQSSIGVNSNVANADCACQLGDGDVSGESASSTVNITRGCDVVPNISGRQYGARAVPIAANRANTRKLHHIPGAVLEIRSRASRVNVQRQFAV